MRQLDKRLIVAGVACAGAAMFFGTTLLDALDAGVPSTVAVAPRAPLSPTSTGSTSTSPKPAELITMQAVNEAVAVDPFSPDRHPSDTPYKLPTDPSPEAPPPPPPPPPAIPGFHLIGTMKTPKGSTALIQVDNGTPRQVAIGETMNGYVIQNIDPTSARLAQGDRTVNLQIDQPSLRGAIVNRPGLPLRGNLGRGGQNDAITQQKMMVQEMQQMMQQERATNGGGRGAARRDTTSRRNQRNGG